MKSGNLCSRKGCNKVKEKDNYIYCIKHYKITSMRQTAKACGKSIPTFDFLEELYNELLENELYCPCCCKKMVEMTKRGERGKNVITLQHWNDGRISLICRSCNSAHAHSKLGDEWANIPDEHKFCPMCENIKHIECFGNETRSPSGKNHLCKKCSSARSKEYYKKNRKERLLKRKEYREQNREMLAAKQKEYVKNNKDKAAEYKKKNKEKISKKRREYRENNKEKIKEYRQKYYQKNKGTIRECQKQSKPKKDNPS